MCIKSKARYLQLRRDRTLKTRENKRLLIFFFIKYSSLLRARYHAVQNPTEKFFKSEILDLVFRDKFSLRHGKIKSKEIQMLCEFTLSFAGYLSV